MKTIIIYASKHGGCEAISQQLMTPTTTCMAIQDFHDSLAPYDQVVLGSSVYASKLDTKLTTFMSEHEQELLEKPLFLFLTGIETDADKVQATFTQNVPDSLLAHASFKDCLGGYIDFDKMNFFERTIIKTINKQAHFYVPSKSIKFVDLVNKEKIQALKLNL